MLVFLLLKALGLEDSHPPPNLFFRSRPGEEDTLQHRERATGPQRALDMLLFESKDGITRSNNLPGKPEYRPSKCLLYNRSRNKDLGQHI